MALLVKLIFSLVQFSRSVVSDSLWPHGLQHARLPCPPLFHFYSFSSVQFSSVAQPCLTLCDPMNHTAHQASLPEFTQTCPLSWWCHPTVSSSVVPCSSCPQSLPASESFNQSTLRMSWPKYWSFSFSIIPSKEHPGLISFRMDWLDLLAVQGLSRVFSNTTAQKHQFFGAQLSSQSNSHIHTWLLEKP